MILLAVIATAHGIQGAVKLKTFTQKPESILEYGLLRDEQGRPYPLKLVRTVSSHSLVVMIEGVKDRNQAEALRGTKLYVERSQLPDLIEEEFYHSDLIGMVVQDLEGQEIGQVRAINNFGAGDFLEIIDSGAHLYTITFTKKAVPIIRLPKNTMEGVIQVDRRFLLDAKLPEGKETTDEETSRTDG